jgi:hypothetical protein
MHYEHYALVAPLYGGERPFGGSPRPMHYEKFWQVCIMRLCIMTCTTVFRRSVWALWRLRSHSLEFSAVGMRASTAKQVLVS